MAGGKRSKVDWDASLNDYGCRNGVMVSLIL